MSTFSNVAARVLSLPIIDCLQCVEALLEPLDLHPVESKTIVDKFAAVGILQVRHYYIPWKPSINSNVAITTCLRTNIHKSTCA